MKLHLHSWRFAGAFTRTCALCGKRQDWQAAGWVTTMTAREYRLLRSIKFLAR